jgi:hypothetical protein
LVEDEAVADKQADRIRDREHLHGAVEVSIVSSMSQKTDRSACSWNRRLDRRQVLGDGETTPTLRWRQWRMIQCKCCRCRHFCGAVQSAGESEGAEEDAEGEGANT